MNVALAIAIFLIGNLAGVFLLWPALFGAVSVKREIGKLFITDDELWIELKDAPHKIKYDWGIVRIDSRKK